MILNDRVSCAESNDDIPEKWKGCNFYLRLTEKGYYYTRLTSSRDNLSGRLDRFTKDIASCGLKVKLVDGISYGNIEYGEDHNAKGIFCTFTILSYNKWEDYYAY